MTEQIFTLGYEGLSLGLFIDRLRAAGVETVVDVRANPLSRKPGFSKRSLGFALRDARISYLHVPAMGCPKAVRDAYKDDGDWAAYTRGFLRHLKEQADSVAQLADALRSSPSCLVCFEADFLRCHRTYVARAAASLSALEVVHITGQGTVADRPMRSAA